MPARISYQQTLEAHRNGTLATRVFIIRTRAAARRGNQVAISQLIARGRRIPGAARAARRAVRQVERALNRVRARRFGVEIEFSGDPNAVVAEAARLGLNVTAEAYNHATRNYWKIVHDMSCGQELVSPPLDNCEDSFEQIRKACKALRAVARVNASCGLHVHIEAPQLSAAEFRAIVQSYTKNSAVINSIVSRSRRASSFAQSWQANDLAAIRNAQSISEIVQYCSRTYGHRARYKTVNVCSFARYGTIEFRQHQGTHNSEKIAHWIRFCVAMINVPLEEIPAAGDAEALARALGMNQEDRAFFIERAMELA